MKRPRATSPDQHRDWLAQFETDGPFLSLPVLKDIWPDGVERLGETDARMVTFRQAFLQWQRAFDVYTQSASTDETRQKYEVVRRAWIDFVLNELVGWLDLRIPVDDDALAGLVVTSPGGEITVRSSGALEAREGGLGALLVVSPPTSNLRAKGLDGWAATEIDRMAMLLRKARVEVGLVTDGQWWAIVWAKEGKPTGSGVVNALTWLEEPLLRDAFLTLIDQHRFRAKDVEQRMMRLLQRSELEAAEITEALGTQVRKSVELLVQAFSEARLAAAKRGEPDPLTEKPDDVYQTAVTIMMRVVFLLFAEQREMLPTEQLYWESYAIRDLLDSLQQQAAGGEEHLDETFDAWHRVLAVSEALYSGVNYDEMRMPAYGGSLLDPLRFPWLRTTNARGLRLKVSDRVMLHVLDSVQRVVVNGERRRISFRDIDVEQIGYIYEGLLGYTCRTVQGDVIIGLSGKDGEEPEVPLSVLQDLYDSSTSSKLFAARLVAWIKEHQPGARPRTPTAIASLVDKDPTAAEEAELVRLLTPIAGHDPELLSQLVSWGNLVRRDLRGIPYVIPAGGLVVIETPSRRYSGAHYTPRPLAEEVVQHALAPLAYEPGPLQTNDSTSWKPKSSSAILDLKIADIAAGSGAFLVAAGRFLADRVTEAWAAEGALTQEERTNPDLLKVRAIREVIAHCLYGADINPMAVEMCKLSLWLVSMDRSKPFSFVDDKIFCGNSLLGLTAVSQLRALHIHPDPKRPRDLLHELLDIDGRIANAAKLRRELASTVDEQSPMRSTRSKLNLLEQARRATSELTLVADAVVATGLPLSGKPGAKLDDAYRVLGWELAEAFPPGNGAPGDITNLVRRITTGLKPTVESDYEQWRPLHWVIEAPDVLIDRGGFDAVVGNPPFLAGKKIAIALGSNLEGWVKADLGGAKGAADLCAHFIRRAWSLLHGSGTIGMIATDRIGQGDTASMSTRVLADQGQIYRARSHFSWPGNASTSAAILWATRAPASGGVRLNLDETLVTEISPGLGDAGDADLGNATPLPQAFDAGRGVAVYGEGFVLDHDDPLLTQLGDSERRFIRPFVNGQSLMSGAISGRFVIDVNEFPDEQALFSGAPTLAAHLKRTVKPARDAITSQIHEHRYWAHWDKREKLFEAVESLDRFIVLTIDTRVPVFMFTDDHISLYSDKVIVIASDAPSVLGTLSSSLHFAWFEGTRTPRGATSTYVVSRCLRTFAFPPHSAELKAAALSFSNARDDALAKFKSPTSLYNELDSPVVQSSVVRNLRDTLVQLDRAVADSYGWTDLTMDHGCSEFAGGLRFTLSPRTRAEVRTRLLAENRHRAGRAVLF